VTVFRIDPEMKAKSQSDWPYLSSWNLWRFACDEDVADSKYYSLNIEHVQTLEGLGFRPVGVFKLDTLCSKSADIVYGEDEEAYRRALEAGTAMIIRESADLIRRYEESVKKSLELARMKGDPGALPSNKEASR
jgi:hypothetical protein